MRFEYMRTASGSYMTVKELDVTSAAYKREMLANNRIEGLLPVRMLAENGLTEYWYDITGLRPMEYLSASGKIGWEALCSLMRNICDTWLVLDRYLLDADDLLYDEKRIFQDRKSRKLIFCYIPGLCSLQENGLKQLLENLLERLDHTDPRVIRAGYDLYEICMSTKPGVEDLLACLSEADGKAAAKPGDDRKRRPMSYLSASSDLINPSDHPSDHASDHASDHPSDHPSDQVSSSAFMPSSDQMGQLLPHLSEKRKRRRRVSEDGSHNSHKPGRNRRGNRKKRGIDQDMEGWTDDDFWQLKSIGAWEGQTRAEAGPLPAAGRPFADQGEDLVGKDRYGKRDGAGQKRELQDYEAGPTQLLTAAAVRGGLWLLYRGSGQEEDIRPDHFPFLVGKQEGRVDGLLRSRSVSRLHAKIIKEDGVYYLEDENSTNGTFVNGEMLACHTPYPLRQEDRILFGEEAYQVALIP